MEMSQDKKQKSGEEGEEILYAHFAKSEKI